MKGKVVCFLLLLLFIFIPLVKAEETDKNNKCTYKIKAEKRKLAANVNVAYDIKQKEDGTYYFEIGIFNIVEGLYVVYRSDDADSSSINKFVFPFDADANGVYKFTDDDIDIIKTYSFEVHTLDNGCEGTLKKLSLIKPKYNSYSELEECKFFDVEEFLYCQKWITRDFGVGKNTIIKRIEKQRAEQIDLQTTECISCKLNDDSYALYQRLLLLRKIVIVALAIGIVVDIVIIVILKRKIKEASFI